MKRDTQRKKLYEWEQNTRWSKFRSYLTKKECHDCIDFLNKKFSRNVKLRILNGHGKSFAYVESDEIVLRNDWAKNYDVILHEYAHILTQKEVAHGKEFVAEYSLLLHKLHPLKPTIKELVKTLNEKNIEFIDFSKTITYEKLKRVKRFKEVDTNISTKFDDNSMLKTKIVKKKVMTEEEKIDNRLRGRIYRIRKQFPQIIVERDNDVWYVYCNGLSYSSIPPDPHVDNHICFDRKEVLEKAQSYKEFLCL